MAVKLGYTNVYRDPLGYPQWHAQKLPVDSAPAGLAQLSPDPPTDRSLRGWAMIWTLLGIFAGGSPLSEKLGIKISTDKMPLAVCTSSGKVGPSLSFGTADAVSIKSASAAVADAAATAVANMIKDPSDIQEAIEAAKKINGVEGVLIIKGENMGAWGDMELVSL